MPSLLDSLSQRETWEKFYAYKTSLIGSVDETEMLRAFIDGESYLPVCKNIQDGSPFPLPKRSVISKQGSQKKRIVYTYPYNENMVLKLLTYLLLRKYDGLFCNHLFSFRPGKSAKSAIHHLQKIPRLHAKYSYKVDVSNYFNSIPVERLLPELKSVLREDPRLSQFLSALLSEHYVLNSRHTERTIPDMSMKECQVPDGHMKKCQTSDASMKECQVPDEHMEECQIPDGHMKECQILDEHMEECRILDEHKGIMAGTPLASFYANLYLRDLDQYFQDQGIPYARYSDDIIVFGDSFTEVEEYARIIRTHLAKKGLAVNPSKEEFRTPEEGFIFLGFFLQGDRVDVAPASITKLKQKMRRKTRALQRWQKRNGLSGEKSTKAFIRIFNRKLLESPKDSDLSWSYWYFSVITTTEGLHVIDLYAQDCIRYLLTGTHTKSRYNARYEDLKALGYQSLVHAFYAFSK